MVDSSTSSPKELRVPQTEAPPASIPIDWRWIAFTFLSSRLWIAVFAYLGHSRHPYLSPIKGAWPGVHNWWLNPWTTYDSQIFLRIARIGYEPLTAGSFPLYPLILRLAGNDEVRMAAWGILVSHVAFFIGLALLYRLTVFDYDTKVARWTICLLAFFPTTAVFSSVYNESLFLALSLAAFWNARRSQWVWAGIWAVLAACTRNSGPLLFLALALEWGQQHYREQRSLPRWSVLATVAPLLGFIGTQLAIGRALKGMTPQLTGQYFGRAFCLPWKPLLLEIANFAHGRGFDMITLLNFATTIGVFLLLLKYWRRQRAGYSLFLFGIIFLHLLYGRFTAPYTNGALRFMSATFPFSQLVAKESTEFLTNRFRLAIILIIYLLICAVMSYLFGLKWFIPG